MFEIDDGRTFVTVGGAGAGVGVRASLHAITTRANIAMRTAGA